ncbi:MAG: OmpA family protein [Armatimonadota bacterium]
MRRRARVEEKENLERWLLTYADLITLLMAFFIMLYSMSVLNLAKFRQAAYSIRTGFSGVMSGQGIGDAEVVAAPLSPIDGDGAGVPWKVIKPIKSFIDKQNDKKVSIGEDERGIVVRVSSDEMLFSPGRAAIRPEAKALLDEVAKMIEQVPNFIRVEGHTCAQPTNNDEFSSNWELSTARATNVLRYLVERKNLDPWRFSAAGYGSIRPVATNSTEEGRRKNRRVEIVILRPDSLAEVVPSEEPKEIENPNHSIIRRGD